MKKHAWKKWAVMAASAAVLLQTPSCVDAANVATGWASVLTAGGVLFLVREVLA